MSTVIKKLLISFAIFPAILIAGFFIIDIETVQAIWVPPTVEEVTASLSSDQLAVTASAWGWQGCNSPSGMCNKSEYTDTVTTYSLERVDITPTDYWTDTDYEESQSSRWFYGPSPVGGTVNIDVSSFPNGTYRFCAWVGGSASPTWPQDTWGEDSKCTSTFVIDNRLDPDFSLTCSPASLSAIRVGSTSTVNLSTTPIDGFNSAVTFTHTVTGGGATKPTVDYGTTNGRVPAATTTATINTTTSTSPGTYTITFTGTGGGETEQCVRTLTVNPLLPTASINANGSTGTVSIPYNTAATINWGSGGGATSCSVTYDKGTSFGSGLSGSQSSGSLTSSRTYTNTCQNSIGETATALVTVAPGSPPPVIADIWANNVPGPGSTNITYGQAPTIRWESSGADTCNVTSTNTSFSSNLLNSTGVSGGNITTEDSIFTISCTGPGGSDSESITVSINAPIVSISANPSSIAYNTSSDITWSSTGAETCSVTHSGGTPFSTALNGTQNTGSLTANRTYDIVCTNPADSETAATTVSVGAAPPVTATISAQYPFINYNSASNITWSSSGADTCSVTADNAPFNETKLSGTESSGNLTQNTRFTINCSGPGGSDSAFVDVNINAPSATISASPSSIAYGASSTITWSSISAQSCSVTYGSGTPFASTTSGSQTSGSLTADRTYSIVCTNPEGSSPVETVTVNVAGAPDFSVACSPSSPTPINAGSSTTINLITTAINGFSNPVTFSESFSPNSGTLPTVSYTNNGAVPSNTTAAVISTTSGTTAATYTITFTGDGTTTTDDCQVTLVVNPITPPNDPVNVVADNSVCGEIGITWNRGSGGTTPEFFRVYHKTSAGGSWNQISGDITYTTDVQYSYTDTSPSGGSNYYAVQAWAATSPSGYAEPSITPITVIPCSVNLDTSDKDLIQVGSNTSGFSGASCNAASDVFTLPNNNVFREGDSLTFTINVCNTGTQDLTNVSVTDTSLNLSNIALDSAASDACVKSFSGGVFSLEDVPAGTTCSIVMTAVIASPGGPAGTLYRFQNTAVINSTEASFKMSTPPYLFSVGSGTPERTETGPQ